MRRKFWSEKLKGKAYSRRPGNGWEDDNRLDLRKRGWKGVDWMHLAQDRDKWRALVNTVLNLWVS